MQFKFICFKISRIFMFSCLFFGLDICGQIVEDTMVLKKPISSKSAFKDGEWLQFRIHYGIFNASYASVTLKADTIKGTPVIHAKGYGKSTGLLRFFFRVEDHYDTFFDTKFTQPLKFIRNIDEGGYTKNLTIEFDQQNHLAFVNDIKNKEKSFYSIKENTQDLLSTFYYLRNYYPSKNFLNQTFKVNMFFDKENYEFNLKYLGVENLETKFGKIECMKLIPVVQKGRVFREDEGIVLWVSNDRNRIPIRMQANLVIGSIKCDLENFKNIKHPFKVKVN